MADGLIGLLRLVRITPSACTCPPTLTSSAWKGLLAEAGIIKDARLHGARHTAETMLGEQHVDIHVIQRIPGQVTTTRIYTEPTDPLTREAAGLMGRALWPEASQVQPELQPEAGS